MQPFGLLRRFPVLVAVYGLSRWCEWSSRCLRDADMLAPHLALPNRRHRKAPSIEQDAPSLSGTKNRARVIRIAVVAFGGIEPINPTNANLKNCSLVAADSSLQHIGQGYAFPDPSDSARLTESMTSAIV